MAESIPDNMQIIQQTAFGDPEVLRLAEAPVPAPGGGEVLVKVRAAAINPVDAAVRSGLFQLPGQPDDPFPLTVGWDLAGEVVAVGDRVTDFKVGDRVFALSRFPAFADAYAEFATVPAEDAARMPQSLDDVHAAALPLAALTAWQAVLENGALKAGERVLIHAAAGGVGHFAVQLAKHRGAHVIGTCSAHNADFVKGLGADEVIDYTRVKFEDEVADIDVQLVPFAADFRPRCWGVMAKGGRLISIKGPIAPEETEGREVFGGATFVRPDGKTLAQIGQLIDAGAVKVAIDSTFPLADAAKSHEKIQGGHARGKIVLKVE